MVRTIYKPGHFYSPLPDNDELVQEQERIWPQNPEVAGIDFNETSHTLFLDKIFPQFIEDYKYSMEPSPDNPFQFYGNNDQFGSLDSLTLFIILRFLKPERFIEIGCGFSTYLTADVNRSYFGNSMDLRCIEPYPNSTLQRGVPGVTELIVDKVQHVPLTLFDTLESGDVLFIDTSHVAKTGSDVNHIYFEILPRLKEGVIIHIHDIFLPFDYPRQWAIVDGRGWNEQYLLRALLMYSKGFEILFSCFYSASKYKEQIQQLCKENLTGGSIWIRKITEPSPKTIYNAP